MKFLFQSDVPVHEREVSQLEMETWCNDNDITCCIETSAKNASNVEEAFKMVVQHWLRLEKRADSNQTIINDTVDLSKKQRDSPGLCCSNGGDSGNQ